MPQIIRYNVSQTREVLVSATTPTEAAVLASKVFNKAPQDSISPEDRRNINSDIRDTDLTVREAY